MFSMIGGPPKWPALGSRSAQEREDKLCQTRSFVSTMRKITMIDAGDGEHAHEIEAAGSGDSGPAPADQEHAETTQMHDDERGATHPIDVVDILDFADFPTGMEISIKPLNHRGGGNLNE